MHPQPSAADRTVARIAARQHGVVTVEQLLTAGHTREAIKVRVRNSRLHRVHRGIFRVGHVAPSIEADYLAAVLACGPGALLAGLAAAHVYGLVWDSSPVPDVVAPVTRRHPGVSTRRRVVDPLDATRYRRVPILTIPALLVDLAATLPLDALAGATHEADVKHHVRPEAIMAAAARRPQVKGIATLRMVAQGDHALLLSKMEREFRALLRAAGLPLPVTNRREGAHYVDCRWPGRRLTVELDSYRFHRTRKAWEDDHERRRAARARGDAFRNYTWRDVHEAPAAMLSELGELLA